MHGQSHAILSRHSKFKNLSINATETLQDIPALPPWIGSSPVG